MALPVSSKALGLNHQQCFEPAQLNPCHSSTATMSRLCLPEKHISSLNEARSEARLMPLLRVCKTEFTTARIHRSSTQVTSEGYCTNPTQRTLLDQSLLIFHGSGMKINRIKMANYQFPRLSIAYRNANAISMLDPILSPYL